MNKRTHWWSTIHDAIIISSSEYVNWNGRNAALDLEQYTDPISHSRSPPFEPQRTHNNLHHLSSVVGKGPLLTELLALDVYDPNITPQIDAAIGIAALLLDINDQKFEYIEPAVKPELIEAVQTIDNPSKSKNKLQECAIELRNIITVITAMYEIEQNLPEITCSKDDLDSQDLKQKAISAVSAGNYSKVQDLHNAIVNRVWKPDYFDQFDYRAFEELVGDLYAKEGYNSKMRDKGADGGVDVIATQNNTHKLIQVKHQNKSLTAPMLDRYVSLFEYYDTDEVIIITSSSFTEPARARASKVSKPLTLIDGKTLCWYLSQAEIPPPIGDLL